MVQTQLAWVVEDAQLHKTCREIETELDGLKETVRSLLASDIVGLEVSSEGGQNFFGNPFVWIFDVMNRINIQRFLYLFNEYSKWFLEKVRHTTVPLASNSPSLPG